MTTIPGMRPHVAAYLITTHTTQTPPEQAAALGLSVHHVRACRSRLYRAGALRPEHRAPTKAQGRPMTRSDAARAKALLEQGVSLELIAASLGRRAGNNIYDLIMRVYGVPAGALTRNRPYTALQLSRLMGVSNGTVYGWIARGWLETYRTRPEPETPPRRRAPGESRRDGHHQITRGALADFLRDRTTWMTWGVASITDAEWQQLARTYRQYAGGRWMSAVQIAQAHHYGDNAGQGWVRAGWPGVPWETTTYGRQVFVWLPDGAVLPEPPPRGARP